MGRGKNPARAKARGCLALLGNRDCLALLDPGKFLVKCARIIKRLPAHPRYAYSRKDER